MLYRVPSFQVVILQSPYETLRLPQTPAVFAEMLRLKLAGYQETYAPGVLPIDTYDFVSTHLMIGTQEGSEFHPLAAFRSVTLERCEFHRLPFPGVAVLKNGGDHAQAEALGRFLDRESKREKRISFASAWTISPAMREHPETWAFLRELSMGMLVRHETEEASDHRLLCGVPKVKTDRFFEKCGYRRFEADGHGFPPFAQASLIGEEAVLLRATEFSPFAVELAEKHSRYWNARRIVKGAEPVEEIAAAPVRKAA